MQILENLKIKEKIYKEKLDNGLTVMVIPKKDIQKKYIIWGVHYGSNDSKFIAPGEQNVTEVPKGVAHFLEHKMFEQENGKNSLDVLSSLGVNANAYTTNNHTAYLYECTDKFYEALDEFMDYIQKPYFTDENVEKEKGIIGQEIMMYDDYPEWKVYLKALESMYHSNPVKLDITGTIETIEKIDKEILYKCYNTFYNPSNMCMVICGDFEPTEIIKEVEKRLIKRENSSGEIVRIYEQEEESIVKPKNEEQMEVTIPLFCIGIKCNPFKEKVKTHIALEILFNIIFGESSELYKQLYKEGNIINIPSKEIEFTDEYAHILISGNSRNPEKLYSELKEKINELKKNGIKKEDFERTKKMIYGLYVKEYNDVGDIARIVLSDFIKGINSFDYIDELNSVDIKYTEQALNKNFDENKMVFSVIKNK